MTTLTHGGQRLADTLMLSGVIITGTYADLNTAATTLGLDATPSGGDGGLREAGYRLISAEMTPAQMESMAFNLCSDFGPDFVLANKAFALAVYAETYAMGRPADLARPDPREQAAAGVGELRQRLLAFNVRDEVDQYEFCGDEGDYTPTERERVLLEDFGNGLASAISDALFPATQPNQTPEAAAPSGSVGEAALREALTPFGECCQNHFHDASILDTFEENDSVLHLIRDGKLSPTSVSVGDLIRARDMIAAPALIDQDTHRRFMAPLAEWAHGLNGKPVTTADLARLIQLCAALAQRPAPQAPVADAAGMDSLRAAIYGQPDTPKEITPLSWLRSMLDACDTQEAVQSLGGDDPDAWGEMCGEVRRMVDALDRAALTPPQAARPGDVVVVPPDVREALKAVADARKAYQQEGAPWSTLAAARARFDIIIHAWLEKQIAPVQADAAEGRLQGWHDIAADEARMVAWVTDRFGAASQQNTFERVDRLLEEVIEMHQAIHAAAYLGAHGRVRANGLVAHVYDKAPGTPAQEMGGIMTCLLALGANLFIPLDKAAKAEIARIEGLSKKHFDKRHQAKVDAGVAAQHERPAPVQADAAEGRS